MKFASNARTLFSGGAAPKVVLESGRENGRTDAIREVRHGQQQFRRCLALHGIPQEKTDFPLTAEDHWDAHEGIQSLWEPVFPEAVLATVDRLTCRVVDLVF